MKIKTIIITIIAIALTSFSSPCFAKIDWEDLKIGEIYYDQPIDEVISKYGKPERVSLTTMGGFECEQYTFKVQGGTILVFAESGTVIQAQTFVTYGKTLGDKTLLTPRGIGLGAKKADIIKEYGRPDVDYSITLDGKKTYTLCYETSKILINDPQSPYLSMKGSLSFKINKEKLVEAVWFSHIFDEKESLD